MILEVDGVSFSYGANEILKKIDFRLEDGDRAGLTGHNGCGKTTLLGVLTGEYEPNAGTVTLKSGALMGYMRQTSGLDERSTVLGEMKKVNDADGLLARMKQLERTMGDDRALVDEYARVSARYDAIDGYNLDYTIKRILTGMSFPEKDWQKSVSVLSGGEKTRLALAKLLVMHPDLLILDEPTNHLDIDTLEWLESFLTSYKGAVLVVSHDRWFLDRVTGRTLELENGKIKSYNGNFSAYLSQKEFNEAAERRAAQKTAETAQKLREYAERNIVRASTSKMAKSRLKMLDRLDLTPPEDSKHTSVRFRIEPSSQPYKEVVTAKDVTIAAGGRALVKELSFVLRRGERLCIIGANGTGKTTFLRALTGKQRPAAGRLLLGPGTKTGTLEQNLFGIASKNPLEYIWDRYPGMTQEEIRGLLASVGFRNEEVFTEAQGLSGGELARLNLARLSLEHPNLLLLDEPTNHLDIYTKDVLYEALEEYDGTLIAVTHDRYLMQTIGGKLLLFENGEGVFFDDYAQYRLFRETGARPPEASQAEPREKKPDEELEKAKNAVENAREARARRAQERSRRSFLEKRMEQLEADIYDMNDELALPETTSDHEKLGNLCDALEKAKHELSELEDEWLENYAEE